MTAECWAPIPGWPEYSISTHGRVRSEPRRVVRCNGARYRVRGRILAAQTDARTALRHVLLKRPGKAQRVYLRPLVDLVWGDERNTAA
ncbi:NUMOD4 domain-containing protein [uncultured Mycobacterium sp.]|uniref:NUMOD4 domain-containing protein n=1 Tax=uncultured Mycobacterium sp. TaxID=171292 RepID=UPI0035CAD6BE